MNRRNFLGGLIGAASAMVLDPEKLLWMPGQRSIFIPAAVVKPARVPFGIRVDNGHLVYLDEVVVSPTDTTGTMLRKEDGTVEALYRCVKPKTSAESPYWMPPFWVQTVGHSRIETADYSPSLAS